MTIFEDGQQKEEVRLYSFKTRSEMHALFLEKGFKKKTAEVIQEEIRIDTVEKQIEMEVMPSFDASKMFWGYGIVGFLVCMIGILSRFRGKKQRRMMNLPTVKVQV